MKNCNRILLAAIVPVIICAFPALGDETSTLVERADRLDAQEQTSSAIDLLLEADKSSPNNPKILVRLSQDYSDQIDNVKDHARKLNFANLSMEYARRAVQLAPNSSEAHAALSVAYGKMTDFVDNKTKIEYSKVVKSEAEKSVELNPKNDNALLVLARWNLDMSTLNPILKSFAQVFYGQLPPASKEKALDYFQRAIAAAPQRIIYHGEYAQALEALGRRDEARAEWRKVRELRPIDSRERQLQAMAASKLR